MDGKRPLRKVATVLLWGTAEGQTQGKASLLTLGTQTRRALQATLYNQDGVPPSQPRSPSLASFTTLLTTELLENSF